MSTKNQQKQPLLRNGSANTPVAGQWLSSRQVMAAAGTHATIGQLLGAVFSVRSVPGLYKTTSWYYESLDTVVRRAGGWCEMAASLLGREAGSRGTASAGSRYQATQWRPWLRTLVCVWLWFVKCSHVLCVEVSNKFDYQSESCL
jgi:hypothetical protein